LKNLLRNLLIGTPRDLEKKVENPPANPDKSENQTTRPLMELRQQINKKSVTSLQPSKNFPTRNQTTSTQIQLSALDYRALFHNKKIIIRNWNEETDWREVKEKKCWQPLRSLS
jgi:hypothetical protein